MILISSAFSRAAGAVNEDAFWVDDARRLYAVSDGTGRHEGAAAASRLVVDTLAAAFSGPESLTEAAEEAARALRRKGGRAGATLTAICFFERGYRGVHIGDSRAYLLRGAELQQLTQDHSVAWEQYRAGAFDKDGIRNHPNQKLLTRTVSAVCSTAAFDRFEGETRPGDLFLLCTDGVTGSLGDPDLGRALPDGLEARLDGRDDATAVVIRLGDVL